MALQSIDSNVWYSIQNFATDRYLDTGDQFLGSGQSSLVGALGVGLSDSTSDWQFLDAGTAGGRDPLGAYLIRERGYDRLCLDASSGSLLLSECTDNTTVWETQPVTFSNGGSAYVILNSVAGYLTAGDNANSMTIDLVSLNNLSDTDESDGANFAIASASQIDDSTYSTIQYSDSSPTTQNSNPTTTAATSSSSTTDQESTSTTTSDSIPTTTNDSIPSQQTSTDFSFSVIDKSVADLGAVAAAIILPPHTNVGCQNCTGSGTVAIATGGYDPTDDSEIALFNFATKGYIDMTISSLTAHIALDTQLLPGFEFVDTFLPIYRETIGNVSIKELLTIEFVLEVGIPINLRLGTPVTFTSGFEMSIPQASFHVDIDEFSDSIATGFDTAGVSLLPYSVSAPDLTLTGATGFGVRITASAVTNNTDVTAGGSISFELDFVNVNMTAQVESNVDDDCSPSSSGSRHARAVGLALDAGAKVSVEGELTLDIDVLGGIHRELQSDDWPSMFWAFPGASARQCLYNDRLVAKFLGVTSTDGARGMKSDTLWWKMVGVVLATGLWFVVM